MDSMETKKKLTTILIHVILIIVSITMLVPFIWMILTAFKTVTEATSVDPFTIFPKIWRKDAFISVINNMNFLLLYKNTLLLILWDCRRIWRRLPDLTDVTSVRPSFTSWHHLQDPVWSHLEFSQLYSHSKI